jgi:hypothetical protein
MAAALIERRYTFTGGYPTPETVQHAYDDVDFIRAMQMYRVFYPSVSGAAIFSGTAKVGLQPNKVFGSMDTQPRHVGYTLNSDTPYGAVLLDLRDGPIVIELPPGPIVGAALDIHQRWLLDLGLAGPDAGKGGRHVLLPPGDRSVVPSDSYAASSGSFRVIAGLRAIPQNGDMGEAIALLRTIKVHALDRSSRWAEPTWMDMTPMPQQTTPHPWEDTLEYWRVLSDLVNAEPPVEDYREHYGELAALGIAKGQSFAADARMQGILERAAKSSCAHMRVQSLADRRPDRRVWTDRRWEWAALRFENGTFDADGYRDTYARDKWFFQAIAASPAMFRRGAGAGSLYWLGLRDRNGHYLDGGKSYRLSIPQPVPGGLFWSVTVYDAETRSQIATDQGKAALRSMFELRDRMTGPNVDLYFGPKPPTGRENPWIKTIPGKGWFVYFRIYGPEKSAFDGSWKPGDFEQAK